MRGKATEKYNGVSKKGITPAYAGKRKRTDQKFIKLRDHPRLCGEKFYNGNKFLFEKGSPPPMRGKVLNAGGFREAVRITPAYAGKRKHEADVQFLF